MLIEIQIYAVFRRKFLNPSKYAILSIICTCISMIDFITLLLRFINVYCFINVWILNNYFYINHLCLFINPIVVSCPCRYIYVSELSIFAIAYKYKLCVRHDRDLFRMDIQIYEIGGSTSKRDILLNHIDCRRIEAVVRGICEKMLMQEYIYLLNIGH